MKTHRITLINKTKNTVTFMVKYLNDGNYKTETKDAILTSGDRYLLRMESDTYIPDEIRLNLIYTTTRLDVQNSITEILGGLRISKILSYKNDKDVNPLFTEYKYVTEDQKSSGLYVDIKNYNRSIPVTKLPLVQTFCGSNLEQPITNGMELFSSTSFDGLGECNGASTGYRRVEVWQGQMINSTQCVYNGGHTVYYYQKGNMDYIVKKPFSGYVAYYPLVISEGGLSGVNIYNPNLTYAKYNDGVFKGPFPYFTPSVKSWISGILFKEEFFSEKNELVKKIEHFNSCSDSKVVGEGLKVSSNPYLIYKKYGTTEPVQNLSDNAFFRKYEIISDRVRLDSTVTTDYQGGKMLARRVRYGYDPIYSLVKKIEEFNPTSSKETFITYPFDYVSPVCDTMTKHHLFYKVESTEKVNGRIVKGEKFDYELGCFNQKFNRQFINMSAAYRWIPGGWDKLSSIRYSKDGDMEEVNSKGVLNSYLWGKYKYYPVVGATGVGIALLKDQLVKVGYKEGGVDTLIARIGALNTAYQRNLFADFNNKFRSGLGKEVQVETYTYDPLLGLTSATNGRGQTLRYRYDGERRLSEVVNNEGKLVGQYSYRLYNDLRPELIPLQLSVSTSSLNFGYGTSRSDISVSSNTEWSVTSSDSWLSCTQNGNVLTVQALANSSAGSRTGKVILTGNGIPSAVVVTVTQAGTPVVPNLTASPSFLKTLRPGSTGLLGTVQVTSNVCWSISYEQMNRQTPYVKVVNDSGNSVASGCGSMNLKIYQIEALKGDSPSAVIIKTGNGELKQTISIGADL